MSQLKLVGLYYPFRALSCTEPIAGRSPTLSSQGSAQIAISEPLTSQGNMIQGANLECVANTPGYPGTGPSFQVIPQSKIESIPILEVKFLPLLDMFFSPLIVLPNTFPASGATKPSSSQFPGRGDSDPCAPHSPDDAVL